MTIARDIRTGTAIGQVTDVRPSDPRSIVLLSGGRYVTVPAVSVRLEVVR